MARQIRGLYNSQTRYKQYENSLNGCSYKSAPTTRKLLKEGVASTVLALADIRPFGYGAATEPPGGQIGTIT